MFVLWGSGVQLHSKDARLKVKCKIIVYAVLTICSEYRRDWEKER